MSEELLRGLAAMTDYAADTAQWEDWQREYRYGVLLILPPDPPSAQINALRAVHDPRGQAICEAHISLTVPLPRPMEDAHWRELESIASTIEAFTIHYGPLMNYLPHPGVCLAIEPQAELDALRAALEAASVFAGAPDRRYPFSAHMTIAEFISAERTETLTDELRGVVPDGSFTCTGVAYTVPDDTFHFAERARLELGHQ